MGQFAKKARECLDLQKEKEKKSNGYDTIKLHNDAISIDTQRIPALGLHCQLQTYQTNPRVTLYISL